MQRTLSCLVLGAVLLGGCKKAEPSPGAVKLVLDYQGFRPSCVRVTAWDADAPDKKSATVMGPAAVSFPLQDADKRGAFTVAVFRDASWGRSLKVLAEAFERGGCDSPTHAVDGQQPVVTAESDTVVTQDGKSSEVALSLAASDVDGDGYVATGATQHGSDCNDASTAAYPGATEVCDGLDNNCDAAHLVDEGWATTAYYLDDDGDGYGTTASRVDSCRSPGAKYVTQNGDCNDAATAAHPDATEVCDGLDNNCDASQLVDEGLPTTAYYLDDDGDGYGTTASHVASCRSPGAKYVTLNNDCNDTASGAAIHPGATEVCDSVDNNCDTQTDENFNVGQSCSDPKVCGGKWACATDGSGTRVCSGTAAATYYPDFDSDGYGLTSGVQYFCNGTTPSDPHYISTNGDCDDGDGYTHPGATEICDKRDNDCNGAINEESACPGGIGSFVSIASGVSGSGFNWRSVSTWGSGSGGVWMVGESGNWARRPAGQANFSSGSCGGSTIWYSIWVDPSTNGHAFFGGENQRLATLAPDGTSCASNPPSVNAAVFTTRGLMGFPGQSGGVQMQGVGIVDSGNKSGNTFAWDGAPISVTLRSIPTESLRDVHGVSGGPLFAVGDSTGGLFPVLKFNSGTNDWVRETAPASGGIANLHGVYVVHDKLAYAVGEKGTLLRWDGASWQVIPSGTNGPASNETLRSVRAFGTSSVYVVSEFGIIYRYNGAAWEKLASPGGVLYDIAGTRPDDIWVVGSSNKVYHWP